MSKLFTRKFVFLSLVAILPLEAAQLSVVQTSNNTTARETREPEAATGLTQKQVVIGSKHMVASANPYASQAGFNILEKGGSAIDAAIAVQLVLTITEPQSSGIGGGAFILHWNKALKQLETFDGRETAPKAATADMFMNVNGQPKKWIEAVVGGNSVGVPGVLHAMKTVHEKYGKLSWDSLFEDAIDLAENGFIVSPRLAKLVGMRFNPGITKIPSTYNYFFPGGKAIKAGDTLKNPELAKVYKSIAKEGIEVFYNGWIAEDIIEAVQHSPIAPGRLIKEDMASYKTRQREAVCGAYKDYNVCGMAPPSSGGVAVIQILAQLERFNLDKLSPVSLETVHLFSQSSRLAFADRNKYIADSDYVTVPTDKLIEPSYLLNRSDLINTEKDMGQALAGNFDKLAYAKDNAIERPSTSHISIVDSEGNAISMTSSVEMGFGSAVMVNGFILNNQLTDFSLSPEKEGQLVANRVEPNKRPRSSMAPMMVFNKDGSLKLTIGSPGGSRIINYVAQSILAILDNNLDPQQAINLPRFTNRNKFTTLEKGTEVVALKPQLESMGHNVMVRDLNSGIQAIEVRGKQLFGGADPRREGKVIAK